MKYRQKSTWGSIKYLGESAFGKNLEGYEPYQKDSDVYISTA